MKFFNNKFNISLFFSVFGNISFKILLLVVLFSLFLSILPCININNDTAHASWYDDDPAWQYRQKFTINNPAGSAVSNYQFLINEGELARWKFDENANSTIGDDAGYDMDGTITGLGSGITWTTSGKYTNALSFDGTDTNYVSMNNPTLLNPTSKYLTLSAWVK